MSDHFSAIRVEISRTSPESEHLVDCSVFNSSGPLVAFGDPKRPTIARSALKPIQVVPLVSSGAAEAFAFSDEDIALASSSHSAEPAQLDRVAAMLQRIGLDESALECGASRPFGQDQADNLLRTGEPFRRIHNCCSGKHAGFLAISQHLGLDLMGYIEPGHRVQQLVTESIETFSGVDLDGQPIGVDGCGIPTHSLPLDRLAMSMVRLVSAGEGDEIDDLWASSADRVVEALVPNAAWMAGAGRAEVQFAELATEPLISKIGAEGVFMAALPERGIGVALKARDGARRAADLAMEAVLAHLDVLTPDPTQGGLAHHVTNAEGSVVGAMDVSWS